MQPETAQTLPGWQYGILGIAVFALATVIAYLFKFYNKRERRSEEERQAFHAERREWAKREAKFEADLEAERLQLRAEYEKKHRELVEQYASALKQERDANRTHEDGVRREFGEMMEAVSAKAAESSSALVELLQKFYDRFVGPRSRSHY